MSNKTKWTPGPWAVVFNGLGSDKEQAHSIYGGAENTYVADVYRGYVGSERVTPDEAQNNASLIAAAPELYAALMQCLADEGVARLESAGGMDNKTMDAAMYALAKARGETQ